MALMYFIHGCDLLRADTRSDRTPLPPADVLTGGLMVRTMLSPLKRIQVLYPRREALWHEYAWRAAPESGICQRRCFR
jgi:hypothetical protein